MSEAQELIIKAGKASTSLLQRRLSIGYGRAAKILDMLEEAGIVGPSNGSKPREILISKQEFENLQNQGISAMPVHKRNESLAPSSYLGEDEVDDSLVFNSDNETEENKVDLEEDDNEDTPAFLLDDDGPEDDIKDETEILEEIKEDDEEKEEEEAEKPKPRAFDDEEGGMFFSR